MHGIKPTVENSDGSCDTLEDFIDRTLPNIPAGPITKVSKDDIVRYVDKVVIGGEKIQVHFKARLVVEV